MENAENKTLMDRIDDISLLVERMKELNNVVFDCCCHTCDNKSDDPDVKANNYYLINNQSRMLIMTVYLSECIEKLETISDSLGAIVTR